jgi:hypothetical protein
MESLYERRELTRNVHVDARFLQRNIHASLVAQLRHNMKVFACLKDLLKEEALPL